jgi:hypothetical protein
MRVFKDGVTPEQKLLTLIVCLPVLPLIVLLFVYDRYYHLINYLYYSLKAKLIKGTIYVLFTSSTRNNL